MTFKEKPITRLYAFALAAVFAIALAGCGGGGGTAAVEEPPPMPTPEETCTAAGNQYVGGECLTPAQVAINAALANIAAAATAEAAQAAYDAVKDDVTATAGEMLQAAVDARVAALATMARADAQKTALAAAAGMIDTSDLSTQEMVDAANEAIRALRQALEDADDVSDEDKAMYMTQLDDAVAAVDGAQGGIDTATRRMNQRTALSDASTALQAALEALFGSTPTQAQLDAADSALTALNDAIADGADLTDAEKATYVREADNAAAPIQTAQAAFDKAMEDEQKAADAEMVAEAAKLYAGIDLKPQARAGDVSIAIIGRNTFALRIAGVTTTGADATHGSPQSLSEDKETMVPGNRGWEGKRYTHEFADGGTAEAYVYTREEEREQGLPLDEVYDLTGGVLPSTIVALDRNRDKIESPSFDQRAGFKKFELPENHIAVKIDGSFHGVPGTYSCTPTAGNTCAVRLDVKPNPTDALGASDVTAGFTLGLLSAANVFNHTAAAWTFKPDDPGARVTAPLAHYSYYGWWLYKPAEGDYIASAIGGGNYGAETRNDLRSVGGTASYSGSAAGLYALTSSTTGGANESGRFTARAVLEADFHESTVTGALDQFKVGADGEARDWSVELMEQGIYDNGDILGDGVGAAVTVPGLGTFLDALPPRKTKWTIGGDTAEAGGEWNGKFRNPDEGGVPGAVTGQFSAEYGHEGRMVGGFAANRQE